MSEAVREMFASIAPSYDTANTVLSFGMHHLWKRRFVAGMGITPGAEILDCATGTGDIAFREAAATGPQGRVVGTDFCEPMLEHARARLKGEPVQFQWADVTRLPFDSGRFDAASIAFGIRNVDDPVKGISEMARVLKPGGSVWVMEFGQPSNGLWRACYSFYSNRILPLVGGVVSGNYDAYRYLNRTSFAFPCGPEFVALMDKTGAFASVSAEPLMGGVAWIYRGVRS